MGVYNVSGFGHKSQKKEDGLFSPRKWTNVEIAECKLQMKKTVFVHIIDLGPKIVPETY